VQIKAAMRTRLKIVVSATIDLLKMAPSFFRTATDQPFADGSGWLFADVVGSPNCSSNLFAAFIQLRAIAVRHFRSSSQAVSAICNAFRACSRNIFAFSSLVPPFGGLPTPQPGALGLGSLTRCGCTSSQTGRHRPASRSGARPTSRAARTSASGYDHFSR